MLGRFIYPFIDEFRQGHSQNMGDVYQPAEDSYLLLKHMEVWVRGRVLDMGTGSGILAIAAARKPDVSEVVAVDINPDSVETARLKAKDSGLLGKMDFRVGDLFEGLDGESFDWIIFNPPYLPSEGDCSERTWSGGIKGSEVISRFLTEAPAHLKADGGMLIVISTLTGLSLNDLKESFEVEVLEELPLFFETLTCLLLRPSSHL